MQVFLVADPAKGNKMDFAGFMRGYTQFFWHGCPANLPARSAFPDCSLANPAWYGKSRSWRCVPPPVK